jgi:deoxyribose-phosphate aldolase
MVREGLCGTVIEDIREVVRAAHEGGARCKVILETALLNDVEKITVCLLAAHAGADFVKTSTGYSKSGATAGDVALMRLVVGDSLGVKAAGGIRTREQAVTMLESGANRIGTSSSLGIVHEHSPREGE